MDAAEHLVELGRDFHRRGWVLGTSGNFSAVIGRDPIRIAITASSLDKGQLKPENILQIDSEGNVLTPDAGKPSAETLLHTAIVRGRGAGAVLHTHSVWSTILSDYHMGQGGFFIEGYEMLKGLNGVTTHEHREWVPILENSQDMKALAAETTRLLEDDPKVHGFLIRRHGMYTWGADLVEAARHVEILEFLLESVGRRQMMEPLQYRRSRWQYFESLRKIGRSPARPLSRNIWGASELSTTFGSLLILSLRVRRRLRSSTRMPPKSKT